MLTVMCSTPQRGKAQRKKSTERGNTQRQRKSMLSVLSHIGETERKPCRTHMAIKSRFVKSSTVMSPAAITAASNALCHDDQPEHFELSALLSFPLFSLTCSHNTLNSVSSSAPPISISSITLVASCLFTF